MDQKRRDVIAQWVFDTGSILGRFHLWLEDVETRLLTGDGAAEPFTGRALSRAFVMATAVTALGTRLFGRYGEGAGLDKAGLNRVKKDADAISAYALSEALWYLTRSLPENHAVMVSLGEGLMPKAGETPEMGSNPLLGFGRVYARPQVAKWLDTRIHRLVNDPAYEWEELWDELASAGVTVWGAAIDTLENTSRFAKGASTGPMTVVHLFDQPLHITRPYEGYVGVMVLPTAVVDAAADRSVLINYATPRATVLDCLRATYPDVPPERVHVWTLSGKSREERLGDLWREWRQLGVHLVEDGWAIPGGGEVFTESGTYAPVNRVGAFTGEAGERHLFLVDGYAASAEAIQAASLDPVLGVTSVMSLFSSSFSMPHHRELRVTELDPGSAGFEDGLAELMGGDPGGETERYRESLAAAREAGLPVERRHLLIDDFFPRKRWRMVALAGYMLPDPYTGAPGIEEVADGVYRVTVHRADQQRIEEIELTLRLLEEPAESRLVFLPLLERFASGQDYRSRPVKISDSGRIRNELQTLCSEAIEHFGTDGMRLHFDRIDPAVLSPDRQRAIREILQWYRENHPLWFRWLELV